MVVREVAQEAVLEIHVAEKESIPSHATHSSARHWNLGAIGRLATVLQTDRSELDTVPVQIRDRSVQIITKNSEAAPVRLELHHERLRKLKRQQLALMKCLEIMQMN